MITKKRVLVACGTSIATATVAANRVKQIADEAGIAVEVIQCKVGEIRGRVQTTHPHLIVAMTPVPSDLGVPVVMGIPFLSGIGIDNVKQQILNYLKEG
jgi:PTS system galactitol-specific IIB component